MELGDRKLSQLLRHMRQLLGDSHAPADTSLLRELFLQRLPTTVRMVLASSAPTDCLEELAQRADRIIDVAPPAIAAITPQDDVQALRFEIDRLKELMSSLTTRSSLTNSSFSRFRSPSHRRTHCPTPPPTTGLCWYHARFGEKAKKCTPPCAKSENYQAGR